MTKGHISRLPPSEEAGHSGTASGIMPQAINCFASLKAALRTHVRPAWVSAPGAARGGAGRALRVVMLLENNPYPEDVRVRGEAEALVAAGHRVTVLAPRGSGQPRLEAVRGVDVIRFRLPPESEALGLMVLEYVVAHLQLIARTIWQLLRGAEVVHLHNPPDTLFPAGIIARLVGRSMVFDSHDLSPELFEEKFGQSRVTALLRAAQRTSMRMANLVIASNESQAEVAKQVRGASNNVVVVRNGPRREHLAASTEPREGVLDDPRLLFLGSLASQDGVMRLPSLLQALSTRHGLPRTTLTVVGDGPAAEDLERALGERRLLDQVRLCGWVPHDRVPSLLAQADICVDPAPCSPLNHRSTMMKIAEYLAAGRPLVAYALLETRRTVAEAGLLVPCGDDEQFITAVARLARDPQMRHELEARALVRREALVWERSTAALTSAYHVLGT